MASRRSRKVCWALDILTLQGSLPEPEGEYLFVDVFVSVYVYRRCPICQKIAVMTQPRERCIDCENTFRHKEEEKRDKRRRRAEMQVEH